MRVLMLPRVLGDATGFYRCEMPAKAMGFIPGMQIRRQVYLINGFPFLARDNVEWADVIHLQRPISHADTAAIEALRKAKPQAPIILDYDDDYTSVPDWNPAYMYIMGNLGDWLRLLPLVDAFTVSTAPLKEALAGALMVANGTPPETQGLEAAGLKRYGHKIEVIKNAIPIGDLTAVGPFADDEIFFNSMAHPETDKDEYKIRGTLDLGQVKKFIGARKIVAWFGGKTHWSDLDLIVEDLEKLASKRSDVVFIFIGYVTWRILAHLPLDRVLVHDGVPGVLNYYRLLKSLSIDISLAPVSPCEFNRSKSALKCIESQALGIYPICSDFETYRDDIRQGLLVDYEKENWCSKISRALDDPERQAKVAYNKTIVTAEDDVATRAQQYVDFYKKVLSWKR